MEIVPVLTIGELERATGVPRTTIHCYLRLGLLPRPQKAAASRSLYTEDHVKLLGKIKELKDAGLSLAEIERELEERVEQASEPAVDLVAQEYDRLHNRIMAVATQEFAAKGYKGTHITTIIRTLGITANLFYAHFPSKRALLVECVSVLNNWSNAFWDSLRGSLDDSGARFMWLAFANSNVFNMGAAALAQSRLEGVHDEADLQKPIEEAWAGTVERITAELSADTPPGAGPPAVPDELLAVSLFGALDETMRSASKKYGRKEILRAHLWLFLAAQAARNHEIDIDSRLAAYEELLDRFATEAPPLPPTLQT